MKLLLERGKASPSTLRRHIDAQVSKDSLRTDLEILHQLGMIRPVGEGRSRHWIADPAFLSRTVGPLDHISMLVGRQLTEFLHGTRLHEVLHRVEPELHDRMPARLRPNLDRKFRTFQEPFRRYEEHAEILDDILDGLLRQRCLDLTYRRSDSISSYPAFRPYTLVLYRRAVYLLGRSDTAGEVHRLAVDRIETCEVTGASFQYPDAWDPDAELAPDFGIYKAVSIEEIVLRFPSARDELVRSRQWHPTQTIETADDGRTELRFRAGGRELVRFALEWGAACEVIAPAWLRTAVETELCNALAQYRESP